MSYERPAIARREKIAGPVIAGTKPPGSQKLGLTWAPHDEPTDSAPEAR